MLSPKKRIRYSSAYGSSSVLDESPYVELSNEHSVSVEIDLRRYCRAVYDYWHARECNLSDRIKELKNNFDTLRSQLIHKYVSGLAGDCLWTDEILPDFQRTLNCDVFDSLAIKALSTTFVEFLKNGMDAMIKEVLDEKIESESAIFILEIKAWLQDDKLHMKVQDNAGGFSESYIESFTQMMRSKSYLSSGFLRDDDEVKSTSDKQGPESPFFGGRGIGLRRFYAILLDGIELNSNLNIHKYIAPEGSTGIKIYNRKGDVNGATIEFFSPTQPTLLHQSSSVVEFTDELPDLSDETVLGSLSLFSRRQTVHTTDEPSNTMDQSLT